MWDEEREELRDGVGGRWKEGKKGDREREGIGKAERRWREQGQEKGGRGQ